MSCCTAPFKKIVLALQSVLSCTSHRLAKSLVSDIVNSAERDVEPRGLKLHETRVRIHICCCLACMEGRGRSTSHLLTIMALYV